MQNYLYFHLELRAIVRIVTYVLHVDTYSYVYQHVDLSSCRQLFSAIFHVSFINLCIKSKVSYGIVLINRDLQRMLFTKSLKVTKLHCVLDTDKQQTSRLLCCKLSQQKRCYYMGYTTFRTRCTHGYCLTRIETGKICFKSLVNSVVSIVRHFGVHRLIPKLHGSLSVLSKMADDL